MTTRKFIQGVFLYGVLFSFFFCAYTGCTKDSNEKKDEVTFKIDMNNAKYSALKSVYGTVIIDSLKLIVTHTDNSNERYIAADCRCTFDGATLKYGIVCACYWYCEACQSGFHYDGTVMGGPALTALKVYKVTESANILTVYIK